MTPTEYAAAQARISAAIIQYILRFAALLLKPQLSTRDWLSALQIIYPEVERQRAASAELAREFYDSQRREHHPELSRNERPLEGYKFEWFVQAMEPSRKKLSQEDAPTTAVGDLARRVVKEVENAGRRQIIRAVENDPATGIVKGWARVATGRETCGWCLMLISRGPVYQAADTAGLDLDDTSAARMIAAGEDVSEHMVEWHTGCDCKVVPVYNRKNWPGKAAADRALELWNEADREAQQLIESGKSRTNNRNREAINALRRRLERGEINPSEYAGLAAA